MFPLNCINYNNYSLRTNINLFKTNVIKGRLILHKCLQVLDWRHVKSLQILITVIPFQFKVNLILIKFCGKFTTLEFLKNPYIRGELISDRICNSPSYINKAGEILHQCILQFGA
jgi:hypothetical protein